MELGITVQDRITGFRGIVLAYVRYLTGCNQALVVPPVKEDGSLVESHWFDEQRLEEDLNFSAISLPQASGARIGFDKEPPKR